MRTANGIELASFPSKMVGDPVQPARDLRGILASQDDDINRLRIEADELKIEIRRLEQIIDNVIRVIDGKPIQ